jgi:hypothetical protein
MTGAEKTLQINSRSKRSKSCNPKRWSFYSRRKGEELAQFIIQFYNKQRMIKLSFIDVEY